MSQENCPANCRTFLVRDEPATEDAFDGPHRKVAEALVSILKEDGGRAVGLEGDWGSGKSTVVEIAREQLKEDKNIEFLSLTRGRMKVMRCAGPSCWPSPSD